MLTPISVTKRLPSSATVNIPAPPIAPPDPPDPIPLPYAHARAETPSINKVVIRTRFMKDLQSPVVDRS
jgi:hypothetical protein